MKDEEPMNSLVMANTSVSDLDRLSRSRRQVLPVICADMASGGLSTAESVLYSGSYN